MKVLLLPCNYLPAAGGVETAVAELASHLKARGHEVTVLTVSSAPHLPSRELIDGIEVQRLPGMLTYGSFRHGRLPAADLLVGAGVAAKGVGKPAPFVCSADRNLSSSRQV